MTMQVPTTRGFITSTSQSSPMNFIYPIRCRFRLFRCSSKSSGVNLHPPPESGRDIEDADPMSMPRRRVREARAPRHMGDALTNSHSTRSQHTVTTHRHSTSPQHTVTALSPHCPRIVPAWTAEEKRSKSSPSQEYVASSSSSMALASSEVFVTLMNWSWPEGAQSQHSHSIVT